MIRIRGLHACCVEKWWYRTYDPVARPTLFDRRHVRECANTISSSVKDVCLRIDVVSSPKRRTIYFVVRPVLKIGRYCASAAHRNHHYLCAVVASRSGQGCSSILLVAGRSGSWSTHVLYGYCNINSVSTGIYDRLLCFRISICYKPSGFRRRKQYLADCFGA